MEVVILNFDKLKGLMREKKVTRFNPYSPGFSIYLDKKTKKYGGNKMREIKRVHGQILRKELKEMKAMESEYDTLQEKLDSIFDIIYLEHDKTREEISVLMAETNEIGKVLEGLREKLNVLQLFRDVENGEQEDSEDVEIEKNEHLTTLQMVTTYKKFLHKKGVDTLGGRGSYKELEVLEKFVIENDKLPENFESMGQNEQKNYIIEHGIFQQ